MTNPWESNTAKEWRKERPDLNAEAMQIVGRIIKLGKILEKRASNSLKESGIYYTDLDVLRDWPRPTLKVLRLPPLG